MSPRDQDWNDENRPSWREIDKNRGKSTHRKEEPTDKLPPKQQAWVKSAALKEAKGIFDKKLSPDAKKLLEQIRSLKGKEGYDSAVIKYLNKFGIPEKWRVLLDFLDVSDAEVFSQLAGSMVSEYKDQPMTDRRAFKTKLSILSNAAGSAKIQRLAAKFKKKL